MLVVTPILTWERFNQDGEMLYEGLISRLKIELFANAHLWNRWILDQSTFTGNRSIETLFAWEHTPGRAIYLGGRHASGGLDINDEPNPKMDPSWALFAKLGWVFER
jgi:hypothetical protein